MNFGFVKIVQKYYHPEISGKYEDMVQITVIIGEKFLFLPSGIYLFPVSNGWENRP